VEEKGKELEKGLMRSDLGSSGTPPNRDRLYSMDRSKTGRVYACGRMLMILCFVICAF